MAIRKPTETDLVRQCLEYLALCRIPAWRNNTGALRQEYKGRSRYVRFGAKGSSDVLGVLPPTGRLLCLECKVGRNRPDADQEAFLSRVRDAGGVAIVVWTLTELVVELEHLGIKP